MDNIPFYLYYFPILMIPLIKFPEYTSCDTHRGNIPAAHEILY